MTQEIGIVEADEGCLDVSLYPIGSFLKIIPYHVSILLSVLSINTLITCVQGPYCKLNYTPIFPLDIVIIKLRASCALLSFF